MHKRFSFDHIMEKLSEYKKTSLIIIPSVSFSIAVIDEIPSSSQEIKKSQEKFSITKLF